MDVVVVDDNDDADIHVTDYYLLLWGHGTAAAGDDDEECIVRGWGTRFIYSQMNYSGHKDTVINILFRWRWRKVAGN